MKVCLVGSSGGHLTHLYMLKPFWKDKDHFWVTFEKEDARSLLEGEKMYPCYYPTNRSIKALIKNTKIAWKSVGNSYGNEEKLSDLLKRLGLANRMTTKIEDTENINEKAIDYAKVDEQLKAHREVAREYLRKNLEE